MAKRKLTARERRSIPEMSSRSMPARPFGIRREVSMEEELDEYSNIPLGRYQNVANRQLKEAYREGYQAGRNSISRRPDVGRLRRMNTIVEEDFAEDERLGRTPRPLSERRLPTRHESRLRGRQLR